jgi:hypothetical protein
MNQKASTTKGGQTTGGKKNLSSGKISKEEKQKLRDKFKLYPIVIQCTNGKTLKTYSTAGNAKQVRVIETYSDPFVHEAWNKDKIRKISKDNPFQKRYGNLYASNSKSDNS